MNRLDTWRAYWDGTGIDYGLCLCGCGAPTRMSPYDHPNGSVKGEPRRYLHNHAHRKSPVEYLVEDRGYQTPCWIWQRALDGPGYGNINGKKAHRVYYERDRGPIPARHDLHHKCENKQCVNPDHLEPLTRSAHLRLRSDTRLNVTRAAEIKRRLLDRTGTLYAVARELSSEYDVSVSAIIAIHYGYCWADVAASEVVI